MERDHVVTAAVEIMRLTTWSLALEPLVTLVIT